MNLRDDIRQLKTGHRDLQKFGLVVGGIFAVLGLYFLLRGKAAAGWFLVPGTILFTLGAIQPRALTRVYVAWMSVAFVLGFVMAHVLLTLLFLLVLTPMGWLARLMGKDFLSLKLDRAATSYWKPRPPQSRDPSRYEKQY